MHSMYQCTVLTRLTRPKCHFRCFLPSTTGRSGNLWNKTIFDCIPLHYWVRTTVQSTSMYTYLYICLHMHRYFDGHLDWRTLNWELGHLCQTGVNRLQFSSLTKMISIYSVILICTDIPYLQARLEHSCSFKLITEVSRSYSQQMARIFPQAS